MNGLLKLLLFTSIISPSNLFDKQQAQIQLSNKPELSFKATDLNQKSVNKTLPIFNITSVITQNIPRYYTATGYTSIARKVEVSTSQAGTIKQLRVKEGDIVNAGALLAVIDESGLLIAIKQAKSAIHTAKINLKDRQHDFNISQRLNKSRLIPAEQFRKAEVQLSLAHAQLVQANNHLTQQQSKKPYYRITSPIKARVIKRWVNQGDLAITGKPLLQLEALQGMEFETTLPVQWLSKIHLGNKYKLRFHNSEKEVMATVSHIIRSANKVTQTCVIKLSLPKNNTLTAGLSGQVSFVIDKEKHFLIPESSLTKRAGIQGVFRTNKKHQTLFTPIKIERRWKQYRIVLSGLQADEKIITNPTMLLRDGEQIVSNNVAIK